MMKKFIYAQSISILVWSCMATESKEKKKKVVARAASICSPRNLVWSQKHGWVIFTFAIALSLDKLMMRKIFSERQTLAWSLFHFLVSELLYFTEFESKRLSITVPGEVVECTNMFEWLLFRKMLDRLLEFVAMLESGKNRLGFLEDGEKLSAWDAL